MICIENVVNNDIEYEKDIDESSIELIELYKDNLNNWDEVLNICLVNEYTNFLDHLIEKCTNGDINPNNALEQACLRNYLDIVKHYVKKDTYIGRSLIIASTYNNFEIVKYIVENNDNCIDTQALQGATSFNNIDIARYLIDHGADYNKVITQAIQISNSQTVKCLIEIIGVDNCEYILKEACEYGNLDIVKTIITCGVAIQEYNVNAIEIANKHPKVVKYLKNYLKEN